MSEVKNDTFGFSKISDSISGLREQRLSQLKRRIKTGLKFIDDPFRGIDVDDLFLIGSAPGVGKTQLVTDIALRAAAQNRRVHLFALEAGKKEIESRIQFQVMMNIYLRETGDKDLSIPYYDWYSGAGSDILCSFEEKALGKIKEIKNLNIFYRQSAFGVSEFRRAFLGINKETDLVLVDHLHYFSVESDNENKAFKEIMMEMRDLVLLSQVPIILVAHLRKLDKTSLGLAPDLYEFHGTSEIGKIVTKALTLAPGDDLGDNLYSTYMRPAKCRQDGTTTRYVIRAYWDAVKNAYMSSYDIGREVTRKSVKQFEKINWSDERNLPPFIKAKKYYKESSGEQKENG